jgi:acetylornithine deacetylase/succinyl-diaminopimelate desuccinylase-like protein
MTRADAIAGAHQQLHSGAFLAELDRRVAYKTESQNPERRDVLRAYLEEDIQPAFADLDFSTRLIESPTGKGPYLLAEYHESATAPTVLMYGHGDVVDGMAGEWRDNLDPWRTTTVGNRVYGRGTADNKGQHSINMAALRAVREARGGRLGFNAKFIVETGEEIGSPDLNQVCLSLRDELKADLFLASDGPRLSAERPTIFLGCRGGIRIHLDVILREGGHHSGNWGGLLSNPAIQLVHALSSIVSPSGQVRVPAFVPEEMSTSVRRALADCEVTSGPGEPAIDPGWGEPGLTLAEKVYAWCTFEILAMSAGNPDNPVNAIPPRASARAQVRFVSDVDPSTFLPALRRHLDRHGFPMVEIAKARDEIFHASRLDPEHPWAQWTAASMAATTGRQPAILPSTAGSLPNDVFAELLGLPTVWVPHSYRGCSQHAPDEHLPTALAREALALMAGIYWDLGEPGTPGRG